VCKLIEILFVNLPSAALNANRAAQNMMQIEVAFVASSVCVFTLMEHQVKIKFQHF